MKLKIIISALVVLLFCYLLKPYPLKYMTHHRYTESKKNRFAVSELPNIDSIKTITSKNVTNIKAKRKQLLNTEERKNKVLNQLKNELAVAQKEIEEDSKKQQEAAVENLVKNQDKAHKKRTRKNKTSKN